MELWWELTKVATDITKLQMKSRCCHVPKFGLERVVTIYLVRNRYVEYAAGGGKDSSQIPAEW